MIIVSRLAEDNRENFSIAQVLCLAL